MKKLTTSANAPSSTISNAMYLTKACEFIDKHWLEGLQEDRLNDFQILLRVLNSQRKLLNDYMENEGKA